MSLSPSITVKPEPLDFDADPVDLSDANECQLCFALVPRKKLMHTHVREHHMNKEGRYIARHNEWQWPTVLQ